MYKSILNSNVIIQIIYKNIDHLASNQVFYN